MRNKQKEKHREEGARDVAQWVEHLPWMHKQQLELDSQHCTNQCGGTGSYLGGGGRKVRSHSQLHHEFKASLNYMRPHLKQTYHTERTRPRVRNPSSGDSQRLMKDKDGFCWHCGMANPTSLGPSGASD